MGKHGLSITYANNRKVYAPGDVVKGSVVLELKKPKKVKKIKINAIGQSVVKLKTPDRKLLRNNEKYFHLTFDLFTGADTELNMGKQTFPFQFQLKPALPTSFEGNHGHVRYSIQAMVEYSGILTNRAKCLSAFTVLDTVDLNTMSSSRTPQHIHCDKKASGMCWWRKGAVTVDITTEKTGYVPGEFIFVNGLITNGRTRPIKMLKVELWQQVTFSGRLKNSAANSALKKHEFSTAVASWNMASKSIDGESAENWQHKQLLQIPPLIPSGLRHCTIIDVQYFLKAVLVIPGKVSNSEITGRSNFITIGTVPLMTSPAPTQQRTDFTAPPPGEPQVIASAPPMDIFPDPSGPPPAYEPGNSMFASVPLPSYEEAVTGGGALSADDAENPESGEEIETPGAQFTPQYAFFDYSRPMASLAASAPSAPQAAQ